MIRTGMLALALAGLAPAAEPDASALAEEGFAHLQQAADAFLAAPRIHASYRVGTLEASAPLKGLPLTFLRHEAWIDGAGLTATVRAETPAEAPAGERRPSLMPTGWSLARTAERSELWTPWNGRLLVRWVPAGQSGAEFRLHDEYGPTCLLEPFRFAVLREEDAACDAKRLTLSAWRSADERARLLKPLKASGGPWRWTKASPTDWRLARRIGRIAYDRDLGEIKRGAAQPIYACTVMLAVPAAGAPRITAIDLVPDTPKTWGVRWEFTYRELPGGTLALERGTATASPESAVIWQAEALALEAGKAIPPGLLRHDPMLAKEIIDETAKMPIDQLAP